MVRITELHIKNFRCFTDVVFNFTSDVIVFDGANGIGKTSLLEAIHYLCYLRSFRTYSPKELIRFGADNFFIKATFENVHTHEHSLLQVGYSDKKRMVKRNGCAVESYKDLMDHCRIVTLTEDDLDIIRGGPEIRRSFIDQAIMLGEPEYALVLRNAKQILDNRNSLLRQRTLDKDSYYVWTKQLWDIARIIVQQRQQMVAKLEALVLSLLQEYFQQELSFGLVYKSNYYKEYESFEDFFATYSVAHTAMEQRQERSLFGPHLDDILITFLDKKTKLYASRGQQKLVVFLLKIAQLRSLRQAGRQSLFLLDDFVNDFDATRLEKLFSILHSLQTQLLFTSPLHNTLIDSHFASLQAQRFCLSPQ